jgi:hypothetical protein
VATAASCLTFMTEPSNARNARKLLIQSSTVRILGHFNHILRAVRMLFTGAHSKHGR